MKSLSREMVLDGSLLFFVLLSNKFQRRVFSTKDSSVELHCSFDGSFVFTIGGTTTVLVMLFLAEI